jgi:hypothetical protein
MDHRGRAGCLEAEKEIENLLKNISDHSFLWACIM